MDITQQHITNFDGLSKQLSGEFDSEDLDLIISLIESALDVNIVKR